MMPLTIFGFDNLFNLRYAFDLFFFYIIPGKS